MNTQTRHPANSTIRLAAVFLATLVLVACGGSPERDVLKLPTAPTSTVPVGSDFTLAPGESVAVGTHGTTMKFTGVVNESRCPTNPNIQCVWAGSATVALQVTEAGLSRLITLETLTARNSTIVDGYLIQLVDVTPAPVAEHSIPPASYRAVLRISEP